MPNQMGDGEGQGGDPPGQTPNTSSNLDGDGGTSTPDWASLPAWARDSYQSLQKQLKTVNDESAGRRHELDQVRQQLHSLTETQKKKLEAEGKFQELAEQRAAEIAELQRYKEQAERYEKRFKDSNAARIGQIPEQMRGLVPTELSAEQVAGWLDRNWAMLTQRPAPDIDAGAGGSGGGKKLPKLTDYERALAKAGGVSEEEYAEFKAKGQPTTLEDLQKG